MGNHFRQKGGVRVGMDLDAADEGVYIEQNLFSMCRVFFQVPGRLHQAQPPPPHHTTNTHTHARNTEAHFTLFFLYFFFPILSLPFDRDELHAQSTLDANSQPFFFISEERAFASSFFLFPLSFSFLVHARRYSRHTTHLP